MRNERDRIARDMHDVIAHSISAMVVQTAAAQDLVHQDPDRAEARARRCRRHRPSGDRRDGRLLHVLRDDADELGLEPAPGLADLAAWWRRSARADSTVDLDVPEPLPPLSAGVDVSAYRIVQEALTNALSYGVGPHGAAARGRDAREVVDRGEQPEQRA